MDRAERTGLAIALVGHGALFTALTIGLSTPPDLPKIVTPPVEVTLTSDVAAQSSSPAKTEPTPPAPATARTEVPTPPEPLAAPPPPAPAAPMRPRPLPPIDAAPTPPAPRPKPTPKAEASAKLPPRVKTQTAKAKPVTSEPTERRRPGLSKSIVTGLADPVITEAPPKASTKGNASNAAPASQPVSVPATQMTGAQKTSLNSLIFTQLKPHWRPPSGADAELLVTQLSVRLNRDGSLAADPEVVVQRGINDSNRAQARLHADRAIQAVRRAAPFTLPSQFYDGWKWLNPLTFDGRLSR
jgi:outer membrane biosynthesis protein TonB